MTGLFSPIQLGGMTLSNRVVIAPMCQYSADDGCMNDWHLAHLSSMAISGAALTVLEATAVRREGRITHGCVGLYSDANEAAMRRVVDACRRLTGNAIGVQLSHAGRKASTQRPWEGRGALGPQEDPWQTLAPSAIAYDPDPAWHTPRALSVTEIRAIVDAFAASAERARRIGLDCIELHASHGYLMHQFFSPLSNQRTDDYGGSLENRLRAPLETARALREAWPRERILGARISADDWVEGGASLDDTIAYARGLQSIGFDYVCVSSGGLILKARYDVKANYQVPFAQAVKHAVPGIAVRAVGMIADAQQAEDILANNHADQVAMARAFLDNPRWVWHAAEKFGVSVTVPPQYERAAWKAWPGAALARPSS